jgi:hypothetical protein
MPIVSSTYTEGPPQQDGRRYVNERHTDDAGTVYTFDWLGAQDPAPVLQARAAMLDAQLAERAAALATVAGTLLPLSKLKFRELFTFTERMGIDALHAQFEAHPVLTTEQKAMLRTGLEDYRMAENIQRPFDSRVNAMLDMYVALGLLTAERKAEIVSAGNA